MDDNEWIIPIHYRCTLIPTITLCCILNIALTGNLLYICDHCLLFYDETNTKSEYFHSVISILSLLYCVQVCVFTCSLSLLMDKGKAKITYSSALCAEVSQAKTSDPTTESSTPVVETNQTNPNLPWRKTESSNKQNQNKNKGVLDVKALFNKLVGAREQAKKQKELTLVGCIIGKAMDFPKIFAKLRIDWRFSKGEFRFSDLKCGWFEVIFANRLDLKKVWEGRPYHISGQLLLLKKWYVGFNPQSESISTLDLWVRIHKRPMEYANPEALSAILEFNGFGHFIRIDPIHNKRKWMTFTRLCINIDVHLTTGKKIVIPNKDMNERKYNVWFDDFPVGCGACGDLDHLVLWREIPLKSKLLYKKILTSSRAT